MKKLSLFATAGLVALMSSFAPVNANPAGEALDAAGEALDAAENYIINPETGEKEEIDPETGAVIEGTDTVVGDGTDEVIEEETLMVEPTEEAASETVE